MNDLHNRLAAWAADAPDRACLVEAETGHSLTYGGCLAAVTALRDALGDAPRHLIAPLAGGIPDAVLWLTALTGGHLLVPLAPDAAAEERTRAAGMFAPDVLFLERPEDVQSFPGGQAARVITHAEYAGMIEQAQHTPGVPRDPLTGRVCLMTSGTTGEPKGVILDAEQVAWTADHVRTSHRLTPDSIGLTVLPLFHVNGPVVSLCGSIMAGSTVVLARKFSRRHFWAWVEAYRVTWVSAVPTIVALLLNTERPAFLPGALQFIRTGAAALPAGDLHAFEAKFGIPLIETYGLSEAASQVAGNPVPPGRPQPGSAGLPVGVTLHICRPRAAGDREVIDVPRGATGEVCISGPSVISAYYGNAGADAFQAGWFRTGDLGYLDDEGYLFLTGRLRDVIIRGGENIAPREVEEVLESHPAVREAGVIGRADAILGEQVVAYVVAREPWSPALAQSIREHAARNLSAPKVPVEIIAVDALPRNEMGKLQHRRLQERDALRPQPAADEAVP